jgi:pantothenate kinase type III
MSFRPRLTEWIRRAWHLEPRFIAVPPAEHPVLPVVRHLALLGARQQKMFPALVLNADVTITLDQLDAHGRRCGAWTLPGERLMRESLYSQTSGIAAAALLDPAVVEEGFGVNTAGAVQEGARLAIAACISDLARRAQCPIIATGRYASEALRWADPSAIVRPDLILEGLAIATQADVT